MKVQEKFDKLFGNVTSLPEIREILIETFSNTGELSIIIDNGIEDIPFLQGFLENANYEIIGELLDIHNKGIIDIFNSKEVPLFPNLYLICMQIAYYIESDIRDVEKYNFSILYEKTIHIKRNGATNYKGKNINPHTFKIEHPVSILKKAKLPLAQIDSILYNPLYSSYYLENNVTILLDIYHSFEEKTEMMEKIFYRMSDDFSTSTMDANRIYSAMRRIFSDSSYDEIINFLETHKGDVKNLRNFIPEQMDLFIAMVYLNV